MARIRSGVLGNTRGKVAGVVGSQWKDVNYLREYVKPANPRTAAQVAQRDKMSDCVAFCKHLVGAIFNSYTDKFQKSMSGFNAFVKSNIALFDGSPDWASILITEGKLFPLQSVVADYTTGDGSFDITWDEAIGNNGALTDKVYACVYDSTNDLWYFADAEVTRDDEAISLTLATGLSIATLHSYTFAIKYAGSLVSMISNSVYEKDVA